MAIYDINGNGLSTIYDITGNALEKVYDANGNEIYSRVTLLSISATYSGGNVPAGTTLDQLTGVEVTAIYSDGTIQSVVDYALSGELIPGQENSITVTYQGQTSSFIVTVDPVPKALTGITVSYSGGNVPAGTTLDQLTGITATAIYSDGTAETVTDYTLSGTLTAGQSNTVTVTYQGKTATFLVTVEAESAEVYPAYYTLSADADEITIPSGIPEQTVTDLRWIVYPDKPAFDNCLTGAGTFPKTFSDGLSLQSDFRHSLTSSGTYFVAMYFEPADLTAEVDITLTLRTTNYITPAGSGTITIRESGGWLYWKRTGTTGMYSDDVSTTGSTVVRKAYAMRMTGTEYADYTASEMVSVVGGLDLVPGQNYEGNATGGVIALRKNGKEIGTQSTIASVSISSGDRLSAAGGACVFRAGMASKPSDWSYIKWCAVGDSLTDTSINATRKYQQIIAEETSINVETIAKGGTGVYYGCEGGMAFYQRAASCRHDSDIVTILGSVNDHKIDNGGVGLIYVCKDSSGNGVAIDDYSSSTEYPLTDTLSDNTFVGYLTECVRVVQSRAPFAKFLIISGLYYSGIHNSYYTVFMDVTKRVANKMGIPYLDLYHSTYEGTLGTSNPLYDSGTIPDTANMRNIAQIPGNVIGINFYQIDTSDAFKAAYACVVAHPNNDYHEQFMAPQIRTELGKIIDSV